MTGHTLFIPVVVSVMLRYRGLLFTVVLCLCSTSLALECFTGTLPDLLDCEILIRALFHLSHMPGQDEPKEYGRTVESDIYSEKIPKLYHLYGPEDYNCGILLDVATADYYAIDTFRVRDLATAANIIYDYCLLARAKMGWYVYRAPFPLAQLLNCNRRANPAGVQHVYAKFVRVDSLASPNGSNVEMISLSSKTSMLNSTKGVLAVGGGAYNLSTS